MFQLLLAAQTEFTQKGHHGAPVCEARLEQVESHESREEIPVLVDPVAEGQLNQDKESGDQAERAFNRHCLFSLAKVTPLLHTTGHLIFGKVLRRMRV